MLSHLEYASESVIILADDSNATTATLPGMDYVDDDVVSHSGANHFDDGDPEVQFLQVRRPSDLLQIESRHFGFTFCRLQDRPAPLCMTSQQTLL